MRKPLWDDRAFKRWVREGAKARGMPIHEVLKAAGINKYYLNETAEGRSTNIVLNLADILQQSPAVLFGLPTDQQDLKDTLRRWESKFLAKNLPRQERMTLAARLLAMQTAALVFLASDQERCDPTALVELVLHELNRPLENDTAPSDPASVDGTVS